MFIQVTQPAIQPSGPDASATPGSPAIAEATPRALHAKLLANAAARRLRAVERSAAQRDDDAVYWKAACPVVVARAAALREERSFNRLP